MHRKKFVLKPTLKQIELYVSGEEQYCPFAQALIEKYSEFDGLCEVDADGIRIYDDDSNVEFTYVPKTKDDANHLFSFVKGVDSAREKYVDPEDVDYDEEFNNGFFHYVPAVAVIPKTAPRPSIRFVLSEETNKEF